MTTRGRPSHPSGHGCGWIVALLCCLVVGGGYLMVRNYLASRKSENMSRSGFAVPVLAVKVSQRDVPIYLDGLGTVQAFNFVTIRVRVDGQLVKVAFNEGQDVKTGDLLLQIDPAPYRAALAQAVAKKAQDEAQLANARLDLKRNADLVAKKIVSQQVYDTQVALVNQLDATVKADQAAIDAAQVNLDYTTVTSPLDGRCGIRLVDQGNIVHAGDTNGCVIITQLHPISVVATLPEQNLGAIQKQWTRGDITVLAVDRDNKTTLGQGRLAVVDNQIDTTTGTLKFKATFPNNDLALWPGQFVNARLLLETRKNGIVVPAAVIQRGPTGSYAFVVKEGRPGAEPADGEKKAKKPGAPAAEGGEKPIKKFGGPAAAGDPAAQKSADLTVELRPVKVALIEGGEALIDEGLKAGELVVVEGQYRLQTGSKVKLRTKGKPAAEGGAEQ